MWLVTLLDPMTCKLVRRVFKNEKKAVEFVNYCFAQAQIPVWEFVPVDTTLVDTFCVKHA